MYHALCHSNAHALADSPPERRPDDWSRVYMGMGENTIAARLRHFRPQAPDELKDFGIAFAILQEHRDRAMERPGSAFRPSEVVRLIQRAESAIAGLQSTSAENGGRWPSTCWSETCVARAPTSSPNRTPAGLPLDDGRGHAKRTAIGNGNVLEEILSPRAMVTRRHADPLHGNGEGGMDPLGRNERPSAKNGLHTYRAMPTGIHQVHTATWNLTCLLQSGHGPGASGLAAVAPEGR